MKTEECLQSLRKVVAEAIVLGTRLSAGRVGGAIWEEANRPVWESLRELHRRTAEFLDDSQLVGITADDVFPLHGEMQRVAQPGS